LELIATRKKETQTGRRELNVSVLVNDGVVTHASVNIAPAQCTTGSRDFANISPRPSFSPPALLTP
jgi:hypothetical protein